MLQQKGALFILADRFWVSGFMSFVMPVGYFTQL